MTDKEIEILNRLGYHIQTRNLSNEFLVELIKLGGGFLNLQTIPSYAKSHGLSYPGVVKTRHIETIFGARFVIDNA